MSLDTGCFVLRPWRGRCACVCTGGARVGLVVYVDCEDAVGEVGGELGCFVAGVSSAASGEG